MSAEQAAMAQDLSFPVKVYVGLVHLLLLFLVVLFFQRPFKDDDNDTQKGRKSRRLTKDNRAVTIESCEWVNSTLAWFYMHAQSNDEKDRTPNIVKLWLRALNKQLQKDKKKKQRIIIDSLSPGCLPPTLTSVYCLCVSGNMQCITFHVESADLGFLIRVLEQTDDGPKTTHLETRVVKLNGEVALQLSTAPSKLEISVQFIGVPEIIMSTKCLVKGSEVDGAEVQEKVKEVICKTITNIPLTDSSSRERVNSDVSSSTSKDRLDSPSSVSCVGEEGKLLVKVIKASGLCGKDKTGPISPYCIVSTSNPLQRKRTGMVRENDSPFWNEYFTFDITPKTKEITLDIYDFEKTEKDDYLGQVIVPLSTVNRDQTCRLILPVLPRSSKSDHSKGDISLEFTFDKDGKVIDASLPLITGLGRKASSRDIEKPSPRSSPTEESPAVVINGDSTGVMNGHVPVRKRYIESSLDELAMEIEAYEQSDEDRPKTQTVESHMEPKLHREPASVPVTAAVLEPGPSCEAAQKEEDEEIAIAELLKSTEGEETEESKDKKKQNEDEPVELLDKGQEGEEPKAKDDEDQTAKEQEDKVDEPELKPKHRRSFNLFKRRKFDKKAEKAEEKLEEIGAAEDETHDGDKKDETPAGNEKELKEVNGEDTKEGEELIEKGEEVAELETKSKVRRSFNLGRFKRKPQSAAATVEEESQEDAKKEEASAEDKDEIKETEAEDKKDLEVKVEEETEDNKEKANGQDEHEEQVAEFDSKPKMRRSFNLFKRRPQSMAAADTRMDEDSEDRPISRHDPVRHSYHAGDLPVPDPSNLRRSTSQSSLLSYSPNPYSTLVIETVNKGQKKYSHIPPVMAKRRAYEKGGSKLHIYNDHIFIAVHFTGSPPECAVCAKSIKGKVGKQGYQCRGCKLVTHRDCHYETTVMCSSDAVKHMEIEYVGDTEV